MNKLTKTLSSFFSSSTFDDHKGQPSLGRKSIAWILLFLGASIELGLVIMCFADPVLGKIVSGYILGVSGLGVGLVSTIYAAAQHSKGKAQAGESLKEGEGK